MVMVMVMHAMAVTHVVMEVFARKFSHVMPSHA